MTYYKLIREDGWEYSEGDYFVFSGGKSFLNIKEAENTSSRLLIMRGIKTEILCSPFSIGSTRSTLIPIFLPTDDPALADYLEERGYVEAAEALRKGPVFPIYSQDMFDPVTGKFVVVESPIVYR